MNKLLSQLDSNDCSMFFILLCFVFTLVCQFRPKICFNRSMTEIPFKLNSFQLISAFSVNEDNDKIGRRLISNYTLM